MGQRFAVGDRVWTVRSAVEPTGYRAGARDGNQWDVEGYVLEVSTGHGICYKVQTWDTWGWYEPDELRATKEPPPQTLWDVVLTHE
jgi:hypothetical protein